MLCWHCELPNRLIRYGLCSECFYNPRIRALYPNYRRCKHRPKTRGKVKTLAERAARGEPLWHPKDAQEDMT